MNNVPNVCIAWLTNETLVENGTEDTETRQYSQLIIFMQCSWATILHYTKFNK